MKVLKSFSLLLILLISSATYAQKNHSATADATYEKGKGVIEGVVKHYAGLVDEIKTKYPCGINPLGFRNPAGYAGTSDIVYDKDHDSKGQLIK